MKCPFYIKVCTKCRKLLVAYSGNFRKTKKGKYGFIGRCKECDKQYREEHKEEISEKNKIYYEENKEEILDRNKEYYENHKKEISEQHKNYREKNKDILKEKRIEYYNENKKTIRKKQKQYYEENKEQIAKFQKQYYKENPHIFFNNNQKRRHLEENQGRGITKEQWFEMMCWFDWCCAYSGEYIGGDSEDRTIDHIICLNNNGLNEPWNCVPMFKSYNTSKHANNMEEWYKQQPYFSEERLLKIYAWCEYAFKKWKPRRKGNKKINEQYKK